MARNFKEKDQINFNIIARIGTLILIIRVSLVKFSELD